MNREKERILRFGSQPERGELAAPSVEAIGVDSPALANRMGSEVDQEFVCTQSVNSQGQEGKCKKKP